jgi:hypothetical protein
LLFINAKKGDEGETAYFFSSFSSLNAYYRGFNIVLYPQEVKKNISI